MSGLAKFFIVLNLLLSLLFFGTSATLFLTRQELNKELQQRKGTYKELESMLKNQLAQLTSDLELARDAVTASSANENARAVEVKKATEAVAAEKLRADRAEISRDKSNDLASAKSQELAALTARNQELTGLLQDANGKRDTAQSTAAAANEARNRAQQDLEESNKSLSALKVEHTDLVANYEQLELRKNILEKAIGKIPVPTVATPPLDAKVVAVDSALDAVVLNVGRDQKVEVGYEFTVHRRGRYIGKVKITRLYRDMAGAKVVTEKEGVSIKQGDSATTRVNSLSS